MANADPAPARMAQVTPQAPGARGVQLEIVVPARNEAGRLPAGLDLLCESAAGLPISTAIIVVDSASTDGTAEIVTRWPAGPVPVRLVRCVRPGKGTAVRAGLLATSAPYVGFCDADMATDLAALDCVIGLLRTGHGAVIGSRAHSDSKVEARHSVARRAGAAVFRGLARTIVPGVSDSQCGFKFFSGPVARAAAAAMVTNGFAFDLELIALCRRLGAGLTEIPVCWRDAPGSKFSVARHSIRTCLEVGYIWLTLRSTARAAERLRDLTVVPLPAPSASPVLAAASGSVPTAVIAGNEAVTRS